MNKAEIAVAITTFYLLVYAMMPHFGVMYDILFAVFLGGNLLVVYMVYAFLRYMEEPKEKWSDGHWYADENRTFSKEA